MSPLLGLVDQGDQSAYLMAAIARTDYISGNTTFHDLVMTYMNTVFTLNRTIDKYVPSHPLSTYV